MEEYINFTYDKIIHTVDSITINNFDLNVFKKILFKNCKLSIAKSSIYGLIGRNGLGKSTLLKTIASINNQNDINKNSLKINTLYVEQELNQTLSNTGNDLDCISYILNSNYKLINSQNELKILLTKIENTELENNELEEYEVILAKIEELENIIRLWDPEREKIKITNILLGLQFTLDDIMNKQLYKFSGGWQVRLSLARALYLEPDILLLDEPTNHLDLNGIIFLSNYLNEINKTIIVVSHNIGFLDDICDYILNIENYNLAQYKGNYTGFRINFEKKIRENDKKYDIYIKRLKELRKKGTEKKKVDDFITKNEILKPNNNFNITIDFKKSINKNNYNNIILFDNVSFGYTDNNILLKNISFSLDETSKIILLGVNGSAKTTLLNLIMNEITPLDGVVQIDNHYRIAYYNQHFEKSLDLEKTVEEYLTSLIPSKLIKNNNINETLKMYLGKMKLDITCFNKKIKELSGGQKSRISLAQLQFIEADVLLLDEITNHMDIDTSIALTTGLLNYQGGMILITHDSYLIREFERNMKNLQIWFINNNKINILDNYNQYVKIISSN